MAAKARKKGFTLIELVVAVTIALFLTGMIIVNYGSYNAVQTLKQSALTLKNDLRFAQSKALSGEKPPSCTELVGYTVTFLAGSYTIRAQCNPEGATGQTNSMVLPGGVTFNPVPPSFTFLILSRGTTLTSVQTVTLAGSGKTYSISVKPGGDISDLGLQ